MSTFQNLNTQRYEPPSQTQRGQLPGLEETGVDTKMWALGSQGANSDSMSLYWSNDLILVPHLTSRLSQIDDLIQQKQKIDAHSTFRPCLLNLVFRCRMFNHWRDVQIEPTSNPKKNRNLWNVQRVKEHPEKVLVANSWLVPSQLAVRRHGAQDSGGEVFCRGACHSRVVSDLAIGRNYLHCT